MVNAHSDVVVAKVWLLISEEYPFLGISPDAYVYDPRNAKCPYTHREVLPAEAFKSNDFCYILGPL